MPRITGWRKRVAVLCFSQLWPDPPLLLVLCMLHHSDAWCRPFVHACCVYYYFNMKEGRQNVCHRLNAWPLISTNTTLQRGDQKLSRVRYQVLSLHGTSVRVAVTRAWCDRILLGTVSLSCTLDNLSAITWEIPGVCTTRGGKE